MPTLVKVITKPPGQIWLLYSSENKDLFYTAEELANTIDPYVQFEQSLPGYIAAQSNTTINGNVFKQCLAFDTMENCINAKAAITNSNNSIVKNKTDLVASKMNEISVHYTVEYDIEP